MSFVNNEVITRGFNIIQLQKIILFSTILSFMNLKKIILLIMKRKLAKIWESNPGTTEGFTKEEQNFHQTCLQNK